MRCRGFEDWDLEQRADRFRQYADTVSGHWEEEVADEEECCPSIYPVTVISLSGDVTHGILQAMPSQIGEMEDPFVLSDELGTVVAFG